MSELNKSLDRLSNRQAVAPGECGRCGGTGAVKVTGTTATGFRETVTTGCSACRGQRWDIPLASPPLKPCLTCQAGLCAEHGAPRTETTTGARVAETQVCSRCDGHMWSLARSGVVTCPRCNGTGQEPAPPPDGPGYIGSAGGQYEIADTPSPREWAESQKPSPATAAEPAGSLAAVLADVAAERGRQDLRWGGPTHDDEHDIPDWAGYITERIRKLLLCEADQQRERLVQIAALAVAAAQSLDRCRTAPSASTPPAPPAAEPAHTHAMVIAGGDAVGAKRTAPPAAEPANSTRPEWLTQLWTALDAAGAVPVLTLTTAQAIDVLKQVAVERNGTEIRIVDPPPAAEPGEMSREAFEAELRDIWWHGNSPGSRDRMLTAALSMFDSLRARAERERQRAEGAEESAEGLLLDLQVSERLLAQAQEDRAALGRRLAVATDTLGAERVSARASLATVTRERDEAREQLAKERSAWTVAFGSDDPRATLMRVNAALAASTKRAKEAEQALSEAARNPRGHALNDCTTLRALAEVMTDRDDLRSRLATAEGALAKAEAEVARLKAEFAAEIERAGVALDKAVSDGNRSCYALCTDDPSLDATDGAHPAWRRGCDHGVRKAAESVERVFEEPLPLVGNVSDEVLERVRQRVAALRQRCERLVEFGDWVVRVHYPSLRAAWAAVRGEKGGA